MWAISWAAPAVSDLKNLDPPVKKRVTKAVERYAEHSQGDVKKLQGSEEYRLRVGDWRVRFEILPSERTLRILRVLHRSAAYR